MPYDSVRWTDGTYDSKRICDNCGSETCNKPVHLSRNKEIYLSKIARQWDLENPVVGSNS